LLWSTAKRVIKVIEQVQGMIDGQDRYPVFDVYLHSTFAHCVGKMMATRAHRLWIVDTAGGPPVGVISLTDVMAIVKRFA